MSEIRMRVVDVACGRCGENISFQVPEGDSAEFAAKMAEVERLAGEAHTCAGKAAGKSWEAIPGWVDDSLRSLYDEALAAAPDDAPSTFVEIGVAFGKSLAYLAECIELRGKPVTGFGIDIWETPDWMPEELRKVIDEAGGFQAACEKQLAANLVPFENRHIRLVAGDSVDVARLFVDGTVPFVFIDGDHTQEGVARDIEAWLPKVSPGGVLAGHDHAGSHPGVELACRAAFGDAYEVRGVCWIKRVPR